MPAPATDESTQKSAKERIFEVARTLFYERGIRAVGVDEIVKTAGVAKISLYRGFPSKDALVVAYLEERNAAYWRHLDETVFSPHRNAPRALLEALLSHLATRTTQANYRGCPFINYCAEFADPTHPGHAVATSNKREWHRRLRELALELGARDPTILADGLLMLVEGNYALSQTLGHGNAPAQSLVRVALTLVDALCAPATPDTAS